MVGKKIGWLFDGKPVAYVLISKGPVGFAIWCLDRRRRQWINDPAHFVQN
jgi:hypothetical protein